MTFLFAQVRPAEEVKAARMMAEQLADDGRYQDAITTLKNVFDRLGTGNCAQDAGWLPDLKEGQEPRVLPKSQRDENRIVEAIKIAKLAIDSIISREFGTKLVPLVHDCNWS